MQDEIMGNMKLKKRNIIYRGKVFNIIVDELEYFDSGNHTIREVVEHPGGAVVLGVLPDKRIILIKQYRYPIDKFIYELPAGKLDYGEDPKVCAIRELEEETGFKPGRVELLTYIYTSPGFCSEKLYIYLAEDLREKEQNLEEGEVLSVEFKSIDEAVEMVLKGEIVDAKSIVGIMIGEKILKRRWERR
ncbi:MAG: NUDIX hydrolase [Candidatus Kryptonium sp.]